MNDFLQFINKYSFDVKSYDNGYGITIKLVYNNGDYVKIYNNVTSIKLNIISRDIMIESSYHNSSIIEIISHNMNFMYDTAMGIKNKFLEIKENINDSF